MIHNFDEIINRHGTDSKKYSQEYFPPDVIPMWLADTDFKAPQPVLDALADRLSHGILGYPIVSQRLKMAVAQWYKTRSGYPVSPDWVEYTAGVIAGVDYTICALSQPGDAVILQTPAYAPFVQGIELNDRKLIRNPLVLKNGHYEVDFASLQAACERPEAKLCILCSPHNPSGRVFKKEELYQIGQICLAHGITVLCDEIHSDLIYPGHKHIPFASLGQDFEENCVTFINPSKTFNLPGLRTAALIVKDNHKRELIHREILKRKGVGENVFGTLALCVAYEQCAYYLEQEMDYLTQNLSLARQRFSQMSTIDLIEPEATYLYWLDCRKTCLPQSEVMRKFVEEAKVGVKDGMDFGQEGEGFVRLNAGVPRSVLIEALNRISKVFD